MKLSVLLFSQSTGLTPNIANLKPHFPWFSFKWRSTQWYPFIHGSYKIKVEIRFPTYCQSASSTPSSMISLSLCQPSLSLQPYQISCSNLSSAKKCLVLSLIIDTKISTLSIDFFSSESKLLFLFHCWVLHKFGRKSYIFLKEDLTWGHSHVLPCSTQSRISKATEGGRTPPHHPPSR